MVHTASQSRSFGAGRSRVDSFEIISAPPRNPVVRILALLLRLRAELFVLSVLVTAWVSLGPAHAPGPDSITVKVSDTGLSQNARIALFLAALVLLAVLPWTRRFLFHRAQAVITRHRVRQALVECRVLNHSRACPLTVWARPTRAGEVVWVVLRAGLSPRTVEDQAEELAASCFAREARVTAWPSMTNVVRVEIIRRDPLAPNLIRSELFRRAAGDPHSGDWPGAGSGDTSPAPAPRPEPARRTVPAPRPAIDGAQLGGRGGDWSDYV